MVEWFDENTRLFSLSSTAVENTITTEFESGKKRVYLKDRSPRKSFTFSFMIKSRKHEQRFWLWYENDVYSGAEPFELDDLAGAEKKTLYLITDVPTLQGSIYPKECTLNVEEY